MIQIVFAIDGGANNTLAVRSYLVKISFLIALLILLVSPTLVTQSKADVSSIEEEITWWQHHLIEHPPGEYLPGTSGVGGAIALTLGHVLQFRRQQYDEVYFSAIDLRDIAFRKLRDAKKFLNQGDIESAQANLNRAKHIISLVSATETLAVQIWEKQITLASEVIYSVYEGSRAAVVFGSGLVNPKASAIVEKLFLPLDYATDRALYGKEVALRNAREAILVKVLTEVVFNRIPIPSLGNKTIGDWIEKGINHEIGSSGIYSVLNEVFRDPAFKAELMRRLAFVVNFLTDQAIDEFAEELISWLMEWLMSEAEVLDGPMNPSTLPSRSATNVSVDLNTVDINLGKNIQQLNTEAIAITDSKGNTIPISGRTINAETLTLSIASSLQPNTTHAISGLPNWDNDLYDWTFTTASLGFHVGMHVIVNNTGGVGLNLRSTPAFLEDGNNIIATLPEGTRMTIVDGPVLADGYTWWKVADTLRTGWSAVGDWLKPIGSRGLHPGSTVVVSNTSGFGLRLRSEPSLTGAIITTLAEGTQVTIIGGPHFIDGYGWWNIEGDAGIGWSAVAYWLTPDTACHLYTSSSSSTPSPFTAGFGVPWNFFTTPPNELVLQASCSAAGVTAQIHKPSSIQYHYTYHQGYQWNAAANQWQAFFYTCTQPLIANAWCPGNATATLNLLHPFFIGYACSWVIPTTGGPAAWKCGCRGPACTTGYWQLQQFQP